MRAHRLALAELRRLTSGKMLRLALAAFLLIPTLYAGLYLWANKDPYGAMGNVPAAIVVEDAGATLSTGEKIQLGDKVADTLVDSKSFDWHQVDRTHAQEGVEDDTYAFALVVPKSFSADVASSAGSDPRQATIEQITNDANGYLSHTIANTVVAQVTKSVASQVSSTAASKYLEGFATIHTKVAQAAKGAGDLETGLGKLDTGAGQLASGTTQLDSAQKQLSAGATKLANGAHSASSGAGQLATGASTLESGLGTMESKTQALPGATRQLADGADQLADGNQQIAAGATKLSSGASTAASGAGQLKTGAEQLNAGAVKVANGAHQVANGNAQVAAAGKAADQAAKRIDDVRTRYKTNLLAQITQLEQINARIPADQLEIKGQIGQRLGNLRTEVARVDEELDQVSGQVSDASTKLTTLADGSQQVADGADQLVTGSATLATKLGDLSSGVSQLSSGATTLSQAATKASTGATKLATGANQLASGATELHDGIVKAHTGASQLSSGASSLSTGVGQLATGADQLASGEQQAVVGTSKLVDGSAELKKGTASAKDGAKKLHDGLVKGLEAIPNPDQRTRQAAAEVVGNPVRVAADSQATAGSYGAGMAPFFTGLALWIGAYVLFLLVRPLSNRALAAQQPAWRVAVSGWMTPALLAIGQAALVLLIAIKGLGFEVKHLLPTLLFMAFVSAVYAAILHFLAARFGSVGKFLGLMLMVVQLVSAGGTFPWQTLPGPLRALHHVLPMSYAIDGLRHLMYGGSMAIVALDVAVLALFLGGALALATLAAHKMRIWSPTRVKPDLAI